MTKAMTLVGLDVHARQTHAAVLDRATGELSVSKLRVPPEEVVAFLGELGAPGCAPSTRPERPGSGSPGRGASGEL